MNRATITVSIRPSRGNAASRKRAGATLAFQPSYDNASWHYGGDFPPDLPTKAGGTHIGMFLAWMWLNGLESASVRQSLRRELAILRARKKTPGAFLMNVLDEKFIEADLSEEGNAFVKAYFQHAKKSYGLFLDDYIDVFDVPLLPSVYHVPDTWKNYDKLAQVIDRRYQDWKRKGRKRLRRV
jgi:hypothetical protein